VNQKTHTVTSWQSGHRKVSAVYNHGNHILDSCQVKEAAWSNQTLIYTPSLWHHLPYLWSNPDPFHVSRRLFPIWRTSYRFLGNKYCDWNQPFTRLNLGHPKTFHLPQVICIIFLEHKRSQNIKAAFLKTTKFRCLSSKVGINRQTHTVHRLGFEPRSPLILFWPVHTECFCYDFYFSMQTCPRLTIFFPFHCPASCVLTQKTFSVNGPLYSMSCIIS